jgi:hypothetical protein
MSAELCAVCMFLFEDVDVCNRHARLEHNNNVPLISVSRERLRITKVPHQHITRVKQCEGVMKLIASTPNRNVIYSIRHVSEETRDRQ